MKVSFEGIGECVATFYNNAAKGAQAASPVKMSGDGEVSTCVNGDRFFGAALTGEGDYCAVQTQGYFEFTYSGTAPSFGFVKFTANGSGGVKVDAAGGELLVVKVDTAAKVVGIML